MYCSHCNGYGSSLKDPKGVNVCTQCLGSGLPRYTLNVQIQASTLEDLTFTLEEIKEEILSGSAMAHDKSNTRRYALSIEDATKKWEEAHGSVPGS